MNNARIFLGGGGTAEQSHALDAVYFSLHQSGSRILYIPVATIRQEGIGMEGCYDWFSGVVTTHAMEKDVDFVLLSEAQEIPSLEGFASVYLGGGNAYRLLRYLLAKQGHQKLREYVQSGGIIYGGSAGAVVLGKEIRTVEEERMEGVRSTQGLNLLQEQSVLPHFSLADQVRAQDLATKLTTKIIAIPEDAGLVLDAGGSVITSIGEVAFFQ
jgi:dipeptidase E